MKVKFTVLIIVLSVLICFGNFAYAQAIEEIAVKGNSRIGADKILEQVYNTAGQALDSEILRGDIRRIYELGYFDDVKADYDEASKRLTYIVKEKPVIVEVMFDGNKEKEDKDLRGEISTKAFSYLDRRTVLADLDALEKYYSSKGFFLAEIGYELELIRDGEVRLRYKIVESKKVLLRRINIIGNKLFSDEELKNVMLTKEGNWLSFLTDAGVFRDEQFEQDRAILGQFYGKSGYIKVKISEPRITLSADKKHLFVAFNIEEGDQYSIGTVDVSGDILTNKEEILELIKIKEGEIADSVQIRQDVESITDYYGDFGYFYVNVLPRTRDFPDRKVVDIDFAIDKGEEVYIERIEISGNSSTRDKVIRRELQINEGELYNRRKVRLSQFNLNRTSYFESVRISTPRGSSSDKIILRIDVVEQSTGSFSLGAGFNSLESFQFIGQVQKRNLFGLGYDIALQARLGGRTQNFSLRYVDPFFLDTKIGFNFTAFSTERQFVNFTQASGGGSIGLTFLLRQKDKQRLTLGVNYNFAAERIKDIRQSISNLFADGITSSATLSLTHDTRNRVFQPSEGVLIRGSTEVADGEFTGDNAFAKFVFDSSVFFPIIPERSWFLPGSILQFHLNVSYLNGLGSRTPLFERFFPGGILSIRGFGLRTLGPQIEIAEDASPSALTTDDFPIGGNKQLIFNVEYVFPLLRKAGINGVVFFDMGNAFAEDQLINVADLRQATGFGIRWFSPLGPLRFEWGFPLDKKEEESPLVFDFTIGSLF